MCNDMMEVGPLPFPPFAVFNCCTFLNITLPLLNTRPPRLLSQNYLVRPLQAVAGRVDDAAVS